MSDPNHTLWVAAERGDLAGMEAAKAAGATDWIRGMRGAAKAGRLASMAKLRKWSEYDWNDIIEWAALGGSVAAMELVRQWGATEYSGALRVAAGKGHLAAMQLAKAWGVTALSVDQACGWAANGGHITAMKLARSWGATRWDWAFSSAAGGGHLEAMMLAREWGGEGVNVDAIKNSGALFEAKEGYEMCEWNPWEVTGNYITIIEYILGWVGADFTALATRFASKRRQYRRAHHRRLFSRALALAPLNLPPYVQLWVIDRALSGPLNERERIRVLEGVAKSVRRIRERAEP